MGKLSSLFLWKYSNSIDSHKWSKPMGLARNCHCCFAVLLNPEAEEIELEVKNSGIRQVKDARVQESIIRITIRG